LVKPGQVLLTTNSPPANTHFGGPGWQSSRLPAVLATAPARDVVACKWPCRPRNQLNPPNSGGQHPAPPLVNQSEGLPGVMPDGRDNPLKQKRLAGLGQQIPRRCCCCRLRPARLSRPHPASAGRERSRCQAHVRAWAMGDAGGGLGQEADFIVIQVDAVGQVDRRPQPAMPAQVFHRPDAETLKQ